MLFLQILLFFALMAAILAGWYKLTKNSCSRQIMIAGGIVLVTVAIIPVTIAAATVIEFVGEQVTQFVVNHKDYQGKPEKTLGMQPTEFVAKLNDAFKDMDLGLTASNCAVSQHGEKRSSSMQCDITGKSDSSSFFVMINPQDQSVREAYFVFEINDPKKAIYSIMIAGAVVQTVDSKKTRENCGEWMTDLMTKALSNSKQPDDKVSPETKIVNGFKYSFLFSKYTGLMLMVEKANKVL